MPIIDDMYPDEELKDTKTFGGRLAAGKEAEDSFIEYVETLDYVAERVGQETSISERMHKIIRLSRDRTSQSIKHRLDILVASKGIVPILFQIANAKGHDPDTQSAVTK